MGSNTFGEVVNDEMLKEMPRYAGKEITQEDRAREAAYLINENGKNVDAINYVKARKEEYGNGVSALCVVYNATGETINLAADHDWHGHIDSGSSYPNLIKNGQGGGFLHVHTGGAAVGSTAAVVYTAVNNVGSFRNILLAWDVPWGAGSNKGYCNVAPEGTFQNQWDIEESSLSNSGKFTSIEKDGCKAQVQMGGGTSPTFTAKLWGDFSF